MKNNNITIYHDLFHLLRTVVNPCISIMGMIKGIRIQKNNTISFVYFHSIEKKYASQFERLILSLKEKYTFISMSDAIKLLNQNNSLSNAYLSLSFDDGFHDNYEAARILKKHSVPATFFIVTEWLNGNTHKLHPVFRSYIRNAKPLSWDEVILISRMGFSIGSHSSRHYRFADLSDEESFAELCKSKNDIENRIESSVDSFSFPYGRVVDYKKSDVDLIFKAGYRYFVTTELHQYMHKIDDRIGIGRFGMEPYINRRSFEYLLHGLLQTYR